jgi:hypothetical protein
VDFANLKRYNPIPIGPNERAEDVDPCIFNGHLEEEKNVHVTLAGCPFTKNFQVIKRAFTDTSVVTQYSQ